ncbi:MAG: hypothetical protein QM820_40295 [Minicystis sp.]
MKTLYARSVQYEPNGDTLRVFVDDFTCAAPSMVDVNLYLDAAGSLVALHLGNEPEPVIVALGPHSAVAKSVGARVLRMETGTLLITMGAKRVRGDVRNPYVPWAMHPDTPK